MNNNHIEEFYSGLKELQQQIKKVDGDAQELGNKFKGILEELLEDADKIQKGMAKRMSKSPFTDFLREQVKQVETHISSWAEREKKEVAQRALRKEVNDSLLVIIYGKVKAGKSTLGNYVAASAPEDMKKEFFVFDRAGSRQEIPKLEELEEEEFGVKATECTTTIQGLRLPGLTWIDTPGLMSTTQENGELAQKYIEAADLIIYPMASDSPARRTDTDEIKRLAEVGKEFCVLITKSDLNEEDEVGGEIVAKWVNKLPEGRKKQEDHTYKEIIEKLQEAGGETSKRLLGKVLSISVHIAKQSKHDRAAFEQSNIPSFYEMLNEVLKKDAVRLKADGPLNNLQAEFRRLIESDTDFNLKQMRGNIKQELSSLKKIQKESSVELKNIPSECAASITIEVQRKIRNLWDQRDSGQIKEEISKIISQGANSAFAERLKDTLQKIAEGITADFPKIELDIDNSNFERQSQTKTIKRNNERATEGRGRAVGGAGGATAGAAIGLAIGGPVGGIFGGVLGSIFGGMGGSKIGAGLSQEWEVKIEVGDNLEDVIGRVRSMIQNSLDTYAKKAIEYSEQEVFQPLIEAFLSLEQLLTKNMERIEKELLQ